MHITGFDTTCKFLTFFPASLWICEHGQFSRGLITVLITALRTGHMEGGTIIVLHTCDLYDQSRESWSQVWHLELLACTVTAAICGESWLSFLTYPTFLHGSGWVDPMLSTWLWYLSFSRLCERPHSLNTILAWETKEDICNGHSFLCLIIWR